MDLDRLQKNSEKRKKERKKKKKKKKKEKEKKKNFMLKMEKDILKKNS